MSSLINIYLDPDTKDLGLENNDLVVVHNSEAIQTSASIRVVLKKEKYIFDLVIGSYLYLTHQYPNTEASRLLAKKFLMDSLQDELEENRIVEVVNLEVHEITNDGVSFLLTYIDKYNTEIIIKKVV